MFNNFTVIFDSYTIVDEVVLASISGGALGAFFSHMIDREFLKERGRIKIVDNQKLIKSAIAYGAFFGLFTGVMAFTAISFDPKNIEGFNFLGVFLGAFYLGSTPILTDLIMMAFSKVFASGNNN